MQFPKKALELELRPRIYSKIVWNTLTTNFWSENHFFFVPSLLLLPLHFLKSRWLTCRKINECSKYVMCNNVCTDFNVVYINICTAAINCFVCLSIWSKTLPNRRLKSRYKSYVSEMEFLIFIKKTLNSLWFLHYKGKSQWTQKNNLEMLFEFFFNRAVCDWCGFVLNNWWKVK